MGRIALWYDGPHIRTSIRMLHEMIQAGVINYPPPSAEADSGRRVELSIQVVHSDPSTPTYAHQKAGTSCNKPGRRAKSQDVGRRSLTCAGFSRVSRPGRKNPEPTCRRGGVGCKRGQEDDFGLGGSLRIRPGRGPPGGTPRRRGFPWGWGVPTPRGYPWANASVAHWFRLLPLASARMAT